MLEKLKLRYRTVLVKISQDLTEKEREELLFYCKDHIPKSLSSILPAGVQIFDRLENAKVISWEKLDFLIEFVSAINRQDLATQLTAFELTRELVIYALKRQNSQPSMTSSTASVGLHLAEMVNHVQDGVNLPPQGVSKSLLKSQQKASSVLDVISRKALPNTDETKPKTLAFLVAIAAEIVWLVFDENQEQEKHALDVAIELANHLMTKVTNYGSWEEFCKFVRVRYIGFSSVPEPATDHDFPWKMMLIDLIGKMQDTVFTEKRK